MKEELIKLYKQFSTEYHEKYKHGSAHLYVAPKDFDTFCDWLETGMIG